MYTPSESGQLQQPSTTYDAVFSAYKSMQYYITWNAVIWFTFTVVLPLYVLYKHAYLPLNSPLRKVREPLAINSSVFLLCLVVQVQRTYQSQESNIISQAKLKSKLSQSLLQYNRNQSILNFVHFCLLIDSRTEIYSCCRKYEGVLLW